jgi:hypothetical protein
MTKQLDAAGERLLKMRDEEIAPSSSATRHSSSPASRIGWAPRAPRSTEEKRRKCPRINEFSTLPSLTALTGRSLEIFPRVVTLTRPLSGQGISGPGRVCARRARGFGVRVFPGAASSCRGGDREASPLQRPRANARRVVASCGRSGANRPMG